MPQILIVTDSTESPGEVVYRERVDAVHLSSEHSRRQLAERLAWGVGDAARAERHQQLLTRLRNGYRVGRHPPVQSPR
jgi:hypothetical protein